jgi:hypothetical protein
VQAQADRYDALANSPMVENRPTAQTSQLLKGELLFQRATQTYLWALPLINTLGMKVGSEHAFGAGYHVLPVWKKRLDAKTLVTTPNSDVIYAMSYLDLGTDGPMVFEAPPGLQGILLGFWQRPILGPSIDGRAFFGSGEKSLQAHPVALPPTAQNHASVSWSLDEIATGERDGSPSLADPRRRSVSSVMARVSSSATCSTTLGQSPG